MLTPAEKKSIQEAAKARREERKKARYEAGKVKEEERKKVQQEVEKAREKAEMNRKETKPARKGKKEAAVFSEFVQLVNTPGAVNLANCHERYKELESKHK